jgi:hypothetical protein
MLGASSSSEQEPLLQPDVVIANDQKDGQVLDTASKYHIPTGMTLKAIGRKARQRG